MGSRSHCNLRDSQCDMDMLNSILRFLLFQILLKKNYKLTIIAGNRVTIAIQHAIAITAGCNAIKKYIIALGCTNQAEIVIAGYENITLDIFNLVKYRRMIIYTIKWLTGNLGQRIRKERPLPVEESSKGDLEVSFSMVNGDEMGVQTNFKQDHENQTFVQW